MILFQQRVFKLYSSKYIYKIIINISNKYIQIHKRRTYKGYLNNTQYSNKSCNMVFCLRKIEKWPSSLTFERRVFQTWWRAAAGRRSPPGCRSCLWRRQWGAWAARRSRPDAAPPAEPSPPGTPRPRSGPPPAHSVHTMFNNTWIQPRCFLWELLIGSWGQHGLTFSRAKRHRLPIMPCCESRSTPM